MKKKIYSSKNLPEHIVRHSPTGMSWGYGGSGPADLAFSMLVECGSGMIEAFEFHQDFKWEVIAGLKGNWKLSQGFVKAWLKRKRILNKLKT